MTEAKHTEAGKKITSAITKCWLATNISHICQPSRIQGQVTMWSCMVANYFDNILIVKVIVFIVSAVCTFGLSIGDLSREGSRKH